MFYFLQLSTKTWKFCCIRPLELEQKPGKSLCFCSFTHIALFPCCILVLHQPILDLIPPNKSFYIVTILSLSFFSFPRSLSLSSLYNLCSTVHCLGECLDLMLNFVSMRQNCVCFYSLISIYKRAGTSSKIYWTWFRTLGFNSSLCHLIMIKNFGKLFNF